MSLNHADECSGIVLSCQPHIRCRLGEMALEICRYSALVYPPLLSGNVLTMVSYLQAVFSFVTWIRPNDATINQLFGGFTGLSLIPLTFDWTYIMSYLGDPLLSPTFSHLNILVGLFVFVIITSKCAS